jgi:CIC family chloride channel protein
VLVCEMAGSYDLLVPLMLAEGLAFVALRRTYLYPAQVPTQGSSPAHRDAVLHEVLTDTRVSTLMTARQDYIEFELTTPMMKILQVTARGGWQDVFPVVDAQGQMVGLITLSSVHYLATQGEELSWMVAADVMQPVVSVKASDHLRRATEIMIESGLRELPVVNEQGKVFGFLDEADIARSYVDAAARAERLSHGE